MRELKAKEWILFTGFVFLIGALVIGVFTFAGDPYLYYRNVSNDKKLLHSNYVNIGLMKNYKFDTAFIGSSEIHTIDTGFVKSYYSVDSAKLVVRNMDVNDMLFQYDLSQKYSDITEYIFNIDLEGFSMIKTVDGRSEKFPAYLYNENKLDDIKYLLGYESSLRYAPINFIINGSIDLGFQPPEEIIRHTEVGKIEDWSEQAVFGEEMVRISYEQYMTTKSTSNNTDLLRMLQTNIDHFLGRILEKQKPEQRIIFGFPPYSALYWEALKEKETYGVYLTAKEYFIAKSRQLARVRIVDVQSIPEINDLNNYKDLRHFNNKVSRIYTDAIFFGGYDIDN
ncbi:hypothetical protein acsn021_19350 [Anaerocolumna cellulosilytica]|uniref:Uncharacterized protein n=1 Tax=Anaerocolumna cellulosilytica TaxID=433286 RepID=A0A6S6QXB2_9FIRM|nr:hypothetical protein [Anaerocolumna cellulosilytica]MBB5194672.1 hypothetical protein [Anaerocolumna cellulosilytica]BCJ94366.1 hypothetical protein acsn021_19350 [Anaerocolumna cellulosilytica]